MLKVWFVRTEFDLHHHQVSQIAIITEIHYHEKTWLCVHSSKHEGTVFPLTLRQMGMWKHSSTHFFLNTWQEMSGQQNTLVILPLSKGHDTQWLFGWVSSRASLGTREGKMSAHVKNENPVPSSDTTNNNYVKIDHRERTWTCVFFSLCTVYDKHTNRTGLTLRWLMSYIYGAPILDVSRSHTTTQHSR